MKQVFLSLVVAVGIILYNATPAHATEAKAELETIDTSKMESLGKLGPSFYWIALEENSPGEKTERVLDVNGNTLVKVSKDFMRHLRLEGTGRLKNGRLLNFHQWHYNEDGSKEVRYRFCGSDAPFGYGYEDRKLKQFRSVAVDPSVVPLDSVLFIPQARGAVLPDGTIHDGYFEAVDIGTAIVNRRIDVFTSFGDQSSVFRAVGLQHLVPTEVFIVKQQ